MADERWTLDRVLSDARLHQEFNGFLDVNGGLEYVLFYENIEIFEKVDNCRYQDFVGRKLVSLFIQPRSRYNIIIPEETRIALIDMAEKNLKFEKDTFDECKKWVRYYIETELIQPFQTLKEVAKEQKPRRRRSTLKRTRRRSTLTRIQSLYGRIVKTVQERK